MTAPSERREAEGLTVEAILRAKAQIDALSKPTPMTIVQFPHAMRGKCWNVMDDGHLYVFMHPDDLAAIPTRPAVMLGMADVPIREFDDEMRGVFIRGIERLVIAKQEGAE